MLHARFRRNAIPAVPREPLLVDKSEGRHAKIGFGRETCRTWLGCLHERERGWVCSQKGRRIPGRRGSEKIEEFLPRSSPEAVRRMAHNVRMNPIREVGTRCEAARATIAHD